MNDIGNILGEAIVRSSGGGRFLSKNNILWRLVNGEWIGKRSIYTYSLRALWLEEVNDKSEIKSWWCGKDSDYKEIFKPS